MKARTAAAKRRQRKGRPMLPSVSRTPKGRIRRTAARREQTERQAMSTATEMRERVHGATQANCKAPEWGYVLGRIYMDGKLGSGGLASMRLEAGNRYARDIARYHALTGIPFPSARAQNVFSVSGSDGEVSEERAAAARRSTSLMMTLEGVLLKASNGRNVATTVKNVCVMDIDESRGWPSHMLEYLRCGLDALVFFYGLQREAK